MKWYSNLFRIILKGIALVLLPVFLVVYVFYKATDLVQNWILPLESHLPAGKIMGIGWLSLLSLAIILLVCYLAGVLTESEKLKPLFNFIENNLLANIPGYTIMKSSTLEALGGEGDNRKAVVAGDEDELKLGIEIDHQPDGQCTIFFPDPPDGKSGEVILMHESKVKQLNIPIKKLMLMIRNYGEGAVNLIK